jgi:hypothetical protein
MAVFVPENPSRQNLFQLSLQMNFAQALKVDPELTALTFWGIDLADPASLNRYFS